MKKVNNLKVLSEKGKETQLAGLWSKKSVMFIFVRHFSSSTCRAHVKNIWGQKDKFAHSKIQIVFIGSGSSLAIKDFKKELSIIDVEIYTDPTLQCFEAFGLTNTGYQAQVGGVVVMKPSGKIAYHFVADYLGTRESHLEDIVESVA